MSRLSGTPALRQVAGLGGGKHGVNSEAAEIEKYYQELYSAAAAQQVTLSELRAHIDSAPMVTSCLLAVALYGCVRSDRPCFLGMQR